MDAPPYYLVTPWPGPTAAAVQALLNALHDQGYLFDQTITDGKTYYLVFKRSTGQP